MEENTAISTPRQNSSNAEGTTRLTKRVPSASNLTLQVTKQPASQQIQQNEQNMQTNTTTDAVQLKVCFGPFLSSQKKSSLQRSGIESRGLTTVVLPAPMIICFTPLSPPSTVRWKSEIMATCLSCSILLSENLAGNQKPARMINGQTQSLSTKSV